MNIVRILDTETTGLNPDTDRIVEIATIDWMDGHIGEPWSSLVNPERDIPAQAKAIHHITEHDVEGKPVIGDLLPSLSGKVDIVAAHFADFDRSFLPSDFAKYWVCTWKVSLRIWPELESHSNQFLRYHFGLPDPDAGLPHRAAYDAFVTAHLFAEELKHKTVKEMVAISREPGFLYWCPGQKHKGKTFEEVANIDRSYLTWMADKSDMGQAEKFTATYWLQQTVSA
jgi:exodeoxyribonuclease X